LAATLQPGRLIPSIPRPALRPGLPPRVLPVRPQTPSLCWGSIPVKGRAAKTGYSRDEFGLARSDTDHNGCDTRNDIPARDLTNETFKPGTNNCVVTTGTLADKYTGTTIDFVRGQDISSAVQIDHVVPLSDAWQLSDDQRKELANDP
jgi:Protein of unknown function (DUF1524)